MIVNVAGRGVGEPAMMSEIDETGDALDVTVHEILLKLDDDITQTKPFDIIVDETFGLPVVLGIDELGETTLAAAGEQNDPFGMSRKVSGVEPGDAIFGAVMRFRFADAAQGEGDRLLGFHIFI